MKESERSGVLAQKIVQVDKKHTIKAAKKRKNIFKIGGNNGEAKMKSSLTSKYINKKVLVVISLILGHTFDSIKNGFDLYEKG